MPVPRGIENPAPVKAVILRNVLLSIGHHTFPLLREKKTPPQQRDADEINCSFLTGGYVDLSEQTHAGDTLSELVNAVQNQADDEAENDACGQGEREGEIFSLDEYVSWELSQ
jgi:hypothetical protein